MVIVLRSHSSRLQIFEIRERKRPPNPHESSLESLDHSLLRCDSIWILFSLCYDALGHFLFKFDLVSEGLEKEEGG